MHPNPAPIPLSRTAFFISIWIFFSSATILFNKWILSKGEFPYPIILTTWHMFFASGATQILRRTTKLMPSLDEVKISTDLYVKNILPIGIFFAASLVFSNKAYLFLSVSFIQMLKASTPVVVLLLSFAMKLEKPSAPLFWVILAVSVGVAVASAGEIHFVLIGVIYQAIGVVVESIRLVLVQTLLSANGLKLDPLSGLYLFAPVCFVVNFLMFLIFELPKFNFDALHNLGALVFLGNALVAFCLNISVVYLLKNSSSVIFTLSDILLIVSSSVIFMTPITTLQTVGYSCALTGITLYNLIKLKKPTGLRVVVTTALVVSLGCSAVFWLLDLYQHYRNPSMSKGEVLKIE